jgi:hypothetical protein
MCGDAVQALFAAPIPNNTIVLVANEAPFDIA